MAEHLYFNLASCVFIPYIFMNVNGQPAVEYAFWNSVALRFFVIFFDVQTLSGSHSSKLAINVHKYVCFNTQLARLKHKCSAIMAYSFVIIYESAFRKTQKGHSIFMMMRMKDRMLLYDLSCK